MFKHNYTHTIKSLLCSSKKQQALLCTQRVRASRGEQSKLIRSLLLGRPHHS